MSSKKIGLTIFSLTILFLALTAVMTLVFSGSAKEIVENAKITTQTLKINGEIASGTLTTKSAHDSSSYYKNGSFYYEAKASNLNKVFIPSISEVQLYCLQKGNPIIYNKEAVDTIRALSGKTGTSTSGSHKARLQPKDILIHIIHV